MDLEGVNTMNSGNNRWQIQPYSVDTLKFNYLGSSTYSELYINYTLMYYLFWHNPFKMAENMPTMVLAFR